MVTKPTDTAEAAKEKDGGTARCLGASKSDLKAALGSAYVDVMLTPSAKEMVQALAERLRIAMEDRIRKNQWMSPFTKSAALAKLAAMAFKVGNPDLATDYSQVKLSPTDFEANRRDVKYVGYKRELESQDGKPNKQAWRLKQYFVNASYNVDLNTLEIPAVLLQPPYWPYNL